MPRAKAVQHNYTFIKGLVQDASPLSSPENTCTELYNFNPDTDGSLTVRKGLALESGYLSSKAISNVDSADRTGITTCRWDRAIPGVDLLVVKVGNTLHFRTVSPEGVLVAGSLVKSISIPVIAGKDTTELDSSPIVMAPTAGYLLLTSKCIDAQYITIDPVTFEPTTTTIEIYERDFEGYPSTIPAKQRPSALTTEHAYNLRNRGWSTDNITAFKASAVGLFPSLTDQVNYGFYDNPTTGLEVWTPDKVVQNSTDSTLASEGSVIVNAIDGTTGGTTGTTFVDHNLVTVTEATFTSDKVVRLTTNVDTTSFLVGGVDTIKITGKCFAIYAYGTIGSNTVSRRYDLVGEHKITAVTATYITITLAAKPYYGVVLLNEPWPAGVYNNKLLTPLYTTESSYRGAQTNRFETTCIWAGRVWYGGLESTVLGNRVYYSQTFEGPSKFGLCHQEADPASRNITELIATDGGVIVMNDVGKIVHLVPYQNYLLLFTLKGVWAVFGRDGIFDATSFGVRKVADDVLVSVNACVATDMGVLYWTADSISMIAEDPQAQAPVSKALTTGVLKNYVTKFGPSDWPYIKSGYIHGDKQAVFCLPTGPDKSNTTVLWFDFNLGAFYEHKFDQHIVQTVDPTEALSVEGIFYHRDSDTDEHKIKVLVLTPGDYSAAFYTYTDATYTDAATRPQAQMFKAKVLTGFTTGGDALRPKQGTYLSPHMKTELDASLYMRTVWDYANATDSNKYSNKQQCYSGDKVSRSVSTRSLRVRGWGRALQVEFTNDPGKPAKLYGWDTVLEMNSEK